MMRETMECSKAYALIQEFVDGRLGGGERVALKRHVARCGDCAEELRVMRSMSTLIGKLPLAKAPDTLADSVIAGLKAAGKIVERPAQVRRVRDSLPGWLQGRARVPLAAGLVFMIALSLFPATINPLKNLVGKGAVFVADTFVEVQDQLAGVEIINRFFENFEKNMRTLKTIAQAGFSLVATAGDMFFFPALGMILVLCLGFAWYFRSIHRRSAHHASSFSF